MSDSSDSKYVWYAANATVPDLGDVSLKIRFPVEAGPRLSANGQREIFFQVRDLRPIKSPDNSPFDGIPQEDLPGGD
jgi:hypothetical protein